MDGPPLGQPQHAALRREDDPAAIEPTWTRRWFPDAFAATLAEVLERSPTAARPSDQRPRQPGTMALLEAAYRSAEEGRAVELAEIAATP